MAKIAFNHDIHEDTVGVFDRTCEKLGPPKYRVVEAAIEAFAALPNHVQYALKSNNQTDRQYWLNVLNGILADATSTESAESEDMARAAKGVVRRAVARHTASAKKPGRARRGAG